MDVRYKIRDVGPMGLPSRTTERTTERTSRRDV